MSSITISLQYEQMARLQVMADHLRISVEDLVRLSVEELLKASDEEFERAADSVLKKNADLYGRLA